MKVNLTTEQLTQYRTLSIKAIARFRDNARYDEPISTSVTIPAEHLLHLIATYEATRACHAYDLEDHYACHRLWVGSIGTQVSQGEIAYHAAFPEAAELIARGELHPYTDLDSERGDDYPAHPHRAVTAHEGDTR